MMRRAGTNSEVKDSALRFSPASIRQMISAARWPRIGTPIDIQDVEAEVRRAPVARFPYYLAYLVAGDVIHVLAVAHERRRPQYWTGRGET